MLKHGKGYIVIQLCVAVLWAAFRRCRFGLSTTRTAQLPIARRIARTTAATTSRTTLRSARGFLVRSLLWKVIKL